MATRSLQDLLDEFTNLKSPLEQEEREEEQISFPEFYSPEEKPIEPEKSREEQLRELQEQRSKQLGRLALGEAATGIGQALGKYYGAKPTDVSGMFARLRGEADRPITEFKEREEARRAEMKEKAQKEMYDPQSETSKMYRDLVKRSFPNIEINEEVPAHVLKGLISKPGKATRAFQQSQYMTKGGDPVTFDPSTNQYMNPMTGQAVQSQDVVRNYVKTITDPRTGEIMEVRPGVGVVGSVTPTKKVPKKGEPEVDYTYDMLNPNQKKTFAKIEDDFRKETEESREFSEILVNIEDLVDSDISAAIPAVKRQLARSVGKEVGVMTDRDVAAFSGDLSLMGALQRFAKMQATGKMTEEDKKQYRGIIEITKRNINKAMDSRAKYHSGRIKARIPNATNRSINSLLAVEPMKMREERPETVKVRRKSDGMIKIVPADKAEKYLEDERFERAD